MRLTSLFLVAVFAIAVGSTARADTVRIPTRYGALTLDRLDDRVNFQGRVLFKGRPLRPDVRGNSALYVKQTFHLPGADAVLFEDDGGVGCPYLWYIVSVSASGATSTPEFGSCGDLLGVAQRSDTIVLRTRGFLGPFEPEAARKKASAQTHEFRYRRGVVTENGKPVPCGRACK